MARKRFEWKIRDQILSLGERTLIVGVLNVTPDSFSDGGQHLDPDAALAHAMALEDAGADILEIGAESTRPGSTRISEAEELRRLVPVLKKLKGKIGIPLAVDTYKAGVATKAFEHGVSIINDPSALTFDADLARAVSNGNAGLILNHMRGTPDSWAKLPPLKNPVGVIVEELGAAVHRAVLAGLDRKRIVIDPGLGFGKRKEQNAEIIAQLGGFTRMDLPLMVGPSRKHFLGHIVGDESPEVTEFATAAAVTAAILNGAHLIRVHDVKSMKAVVDVADEILRGANIPEPMEAPAAKKSNFASREDGGYRAGMARGQRPAAETKSKALVPPISKPARKPIEPVEPVEEEEITPIAPAIFKAAPELDADDELEVDALDETDELADEELDDNSDLDDLIIELNEDDDEEDDEIDEDDDEESEDDELDSSDDAVEEVAAKSKKPARNQPIARDPRVGRGATGPQDRQGATRGSSRPPFTKSTGREASDRGPSRGTGGFKPVRRPGDRAAAGGPSRAGERPSFEKRPFEKRSGPPRRDEGRSGPPRSGPPRRDEGRGDQDDRRPRFGARSNDDRGGDNERGESRPPTRFGGFRKPFGSKPGGSAGPGARPSGPRPFKKPYETKPFSKDNDRPSRGADTGKPSYRTEDLVAGRPKREGFSSGPPKSGGFRRGPSSDRPESDRPSGGKPSFGKPGFKKPFGKPSFGKGPSSSGRPSTGKPGFKKPGGRPTSSGSGGRSGSPSGRRPPSGPRRGK